MSVRVGIFSEPANGHTLSANITAGAATLVYVGTDNYAAKDVIAIDNEWMVVSSINVGTKTLTVGRGIFTTAASHTAGAQIGKVTLLSVVSKPDAMATRVSTLWAGGGGSAADNALAFMYDAFKQSTITKAIVAAAASSEAAVLSARAAELAAVTADL